jgi:hypothetical protein
MAETATTPIQIEAQPPVAPGAPGTGPVRFDVLAPLARQRCPGNPEGEIVVCATDNEQFRLRLLPDQSQPRSEAPQLKLGENAAAGVGLERGSVGGVPSNRVMVKMKLKF